jgi:hypothetical protein
MGRLMIWKKVNINFMPLESFANLNQALNNNFENINNYINKNEEEVLYVSTNLNIPSQNNNLDKPLIISREIGVDTLDLVEDNEFNFEELKKNYLNNMISWQFLTKLSDFNQWPLNCIITFIENSMKEEVQSKNIHITCKAYDKKVYSVTRDNLQITALDQIKDFTEKVLVLTIIDDGKGIPIKEFNQNLYSFSINEKKEYNFFKYGISMKTSALRLANSFFIISKTETDLSIGILSKNLQIKMDTDFILSPIVNFKIDSMSQSTDGRYLPRSNFANQSLNLILNEVKFIFYDYKELFHYIDSFMIGTHIFLYDLKQISAGKDLNQLTNYELLFDDEKKDIMFNYFNIQIGEGSFIDCSLKTLLKFINLRSLNNINVRLFDERVNMSNPLLSISNISKNTSEAIKISSNMKTEEKEANCFLIDGEIYKGLFFNPTYFNILSSTYNFENTFEEKEIFNGILLYRNNRLISRFGQQKFGDISYFVKKYMKCKDEDNFIFFKTSGYLELPPSNYDILYNKTVKYLYDN